MRREQVEHFELQESLSEERASNSWCRRIPLDTIDRVVVARLGQTRVSGNAKPAVLNRQIAMYIAKHFGGWSTTRIGRFYNGRDHSTVCYALKRVCALRKDDAELDRLITSLVSENQEHRGEGHRPNRQPDLDG